MQSLSQPGALPAEESPTACAPSTEQRASRAAEHPPGPPQSQTVTMNCHDCEAEEEAPGRALELCTSHGQERAAPEGYDQANPPQQDSVQGELLRTLDALHLAEPAVPALQLRRYRDQSTAPPTMRGLHFRDARYPEPLSTDWSPRRRARSLPWNSIPEVDVEDDDDSPLMCCYKLKKKVQFADSLGFCLASVKHFLPSDEPLVPQAVFARLQSYPPDPPVPEFEDLCISESPVPAELLARLDEQRVCLEQVLASFWGVKGHVLVKDPGENAQVKIRYTFNEWLSFLDCPTSEVQQSTAPGTHRFRFNLSYPPSTSLIHFAICFITGHGQELWDNNQGANYTVRCQQNLSPNIQSSGPEQEACEGSRLW